MKKNASNFILVLILIIGLSLVLYPSFAEYWNSFTSSRAIATYTEQVATIDNDAYDKLWQEANAYNQTLLGRNNEFLLSEEQKAEYLRLLDVSGLGIMGYIEIPCIDVSLPIYHGTEDTVLQIAVGHLEWTSLPVGGESTHCVLSGHRGLPSAKLFTDLDQVKEGDYFMLHVLDQTMTYEVDQIRIVLPHEVDELLIREGKDLCTLVTCTPYGVNSHRMLVRGHRIDNLEEQPVIRITSDAVVIEKLVVAPFVLVPILLVMLLFLLVSSPKKRK